MDVETIKAVGSILLGILGVGGIGGAYFTYKSNKPKSIAEANKLEADVIVTFADGWKNYAEKIEKRMNELEALIEAKDKAHAKVVVEKDKRISELERRVGELEMEVERYRGMDSKVETAKTDLHLSVDNTLEHLKEERRQ